MEDSNLEESEAYWETAMLYGIDGINDSYDLEPPEDDRQGY
jgi:hypothetical protein